MQAYIHTHTHRERERERRETMNKTGLVLAETEPLVHVVTDKSLQYTPSWRIPKIDHAASYTSLVDSPQSS